MTDLSSASSISDTLRVCERFVSLSGESTRQGEAAWFVRLGGCNLRCVWCDTAYAWEEGEAVAIDALVDEAVASGAKLAIVTGGEPLLQAAVNALVARLADRGFTAMVETNGTHDVRNLDPRAIRVIDVKPPSAEAAEPFFLENLTDLRPSDELKFVVGDRADFDFAVDFVARHGLVGRCPLLISPLHGAVDPAEVAQWILDAGLGLRLQLQLHKMLWGEHTQGR